MFVATMESESCSWIALGVTENDAKEALMERWNSHQAHLYENGTINAPWYVSNPKYLEEEYGVLVIRLQPGQCKMDWEV